MAANCCYFSSSCETFEHDVYSPCVCVLQCNNIIAPFHKTTQSASDDTGNYIQMRMGSENYFLNENIQLTEICIFMQKKKKRK